MASKLLPLLERWHLKPENPFFLIFRLYKQQFLDQSINKGLIDPKHLALAGDGTPVRTAAQQRKKRTCDCKENGSPSCRCKCRYSQPDCNWGWDPSGMLFLRLPSLHVCGIRFSQRSSRIPSFGTGFPARHAFLSALLFFHESIPSGIPD